MTTCLLAHRLMMISVPSLSLRNVCMCDEMIRKQSREWEGRGSFKEIFRGFFFV